MRRDISLELILHDEVSNLLDNFVALMKIQAAFFAADGRVLKRGRDQGNSEYCQLMQQQVFGLDRCLKLDHEKQQECRAKRRMICYRCHAHLNEVIAPVFVMGDVAGFIILGQFRTTGELPECARTEAMRKAFFQLPYIEAEALSHLLNLFQMLVDYIVSKELISLGRDRKIIEIDRYLNGKPTEKITLGAMARHLHCSTSTLTHYLKNEHHTTFKKLLTEKRLQRACRKLKESPELSIAEVAASSGFEDAHYFSRLFLKHYHQSPSQFRKQSI